MYFSSSTNIHVLQLEHMYFSLSSQRAQTIEFSIEISTEIKGNLLERAKGAIH